MSIKTSLTRRQALLLSGSAAAGLVAAAIATMGASCPVSGTGPADPAADRGAQQRAGRAHLAEDAASIWLRAGGGVTGHIRQLPGSGRACPQWRHHPVPRREPPRRGDDAALARDAGAVARRRRTAQHDQAGSGVDAGDHDQAAREHELVPSAPAREDCPASLLGARRHDDRQRRRRPRSRAARDLWRRRPADRAAGQAVRPQRRGRVPARHDGHHAWLPGRHSGREWGHRPHGERTCGDRAPAPAECGERPRFRSALLRPAAVLRCRR